MAHGVRGHLDATVVLDYDFKFVFHGYLLVRVMWTLAAVWVRHPNLRAAEVTACAL